jgi:hypothetical protein
MVATRVNSREVGLARLGFDRDTMPLSRCPSIFRRQAESFSGWVLKGAVVADDEDRGEIPFVMGTQIPLGLKSQKQADLSGYLIE